jgi:tetratricopeptide (TPR) repeat protein
MLAEFHLSAGNRSAARKLLEAAAAEGTSHPQLYLTFARLALAEGRLTEALLHFEKMEALGVPTGWPDSEKLQVEAAILEGKSMVAELRGNWEAAQSQLARLVELDPKNPGLRQRWAKALYLAGRENNAFEQFDIAYRQDNQLNRPEAAIGALLTRQGKFAEANRTFAKALDASPDDGALQFAWAMALMY